MARLADKVVGLTGAAGGLGAATARLMAKEGARLALTDIDGSALARLADELTSRGAEIEVEIGDVTLVETHANLVRKAVQRWGGLHGWCNIAGVLGAGDLPDVTTERFDQVMHGNCLAQLLAVQQAAPAIQASGGGAIVNVASVGALVALPHMTVYCASKAAVVGLTRALAAELSPAIRCNALCPGGIDTGMSRRLLADAPPEQRDGLIAKLTGRQHIKRFATPEEIAPTLVHLVSDESSFITGAVIAADGGHSSW